MRKKIYLMTDEGKLKEHIVEYNYNNVLDYINRKSIELGGRAECWHSKNPIQYEREIKPNERLCHKTIWCPYTTFEEVFGRTKTEPTAEVYTIFADEEPMIESLLKVLEVNKTSIGQFDNLNTIIHGVAGFIRVKEANLINYFRRTSYLSLESLENINDNKRLLEEYIKMFDFVPSLGKSVEFEEAKDNITKAVGLAYDAYIYQNCKEPNVTKEEVLENLLNKAEEDYKIIESDAIINAKVLKKVL